MDELLAILPASGVEGERKFVHSNHLYSVAALTDNTGAVVERYRYDAYGQRIVLAGDGVTLRWGSSHGNQVGFTGRYLDKETGLWYFRARYYSGSLGRFVSRDPWAKERWRPRASDGYRDGYNFYASYFVPNYTDPSGMWCCFKAGQKWELDGWSSKADCLRHWDYSIPTPLGDVGGVGSGLASLGTTDLTSVAFGGLSVAIGGWQIKSWSVCEDHCGGRYCVTLGHWKIALGNLTYTTKECLVGTVSGDTKCVSNTDWIDGAIQIPDPDGGFMEYIIK